jgi:hypothetical protein
MTRQSQGSITYPGMTPNSSGVTRPPVTGGALNFLRIPMRKLDDPQVRRVSLRLSSTEYEIVEVAARMAKSVPSTFCRDLVLAVTRSALRTRFPSEEDGRASRR